MKKRVKQSSAKKQSNVRVSKKSAKRKTGTSAKEKSVKKAVVHGADDSHVYVKVAHTHLKKHIPGKHKHHVIPVKRDAHHKEFRPGDIVHIDILEIERKVLRVLYAILPVLAVLIGLLIALIVGTDIVGTLVLIVLFLALGYNLRSILRKHTDIFREIEVKAYPHKNKK